MSNVQLIFTIAFGILFWVLPYFIGLYVCKKVEILKKHINKFSILAWKNQYSSTKRAKNKGKTKSILNDDYYYGYSGTLLAAYLIGFIQP